MKSTSRLALAIASLAVFSSFGLSTAHAIQTGFTLGDASNYAVLYEGGGNNQLQINNGPGPGGLAIVGNIGLGTGLAGAGTPKLQLSGPLTIDGNTRFAGSVNDNGPYSGNIVINGTITGGVTQVQTDLNTLNTLSSTLGGESGMGVTIGGITSQTINVSGGIVDGSGNEVFTANTNSFNTNDTLTIHGDGTHNVVFNFSGNQQFNGTILLTGGLTSDEVLFNFIGGSNLSGGPTLQFSANGETETGTFLDPNGNIQDDNTVLDGRLFGGGNQNMQIVSGAEVVAPPSLPDASSTLILLVLACVGLASAAYKFKLAQ